MEIEEKVLDIPAVEIKRLLMLRGSNQKVLAKKMNVSYSIVSKFLSQDGYVSHEGKRHKYKVPHIRRAIAEYLNIPHGDLWGPRGREILNGLIENELHHLKLKRISYVRFALGAGLFRRGWSFVRLLKNLLSLGNSDIHIYKYEKREK